MKLLSIVGARPQFVKIAPLVRAIGLRATRGGPAIEHVIVHTGQHYDPSMSDIFFAELDLPEAQINLNVGSGTHGVQTGAMLARIEQVLMDVAPDAVVVYGDTNSTLAGALASAKLHIPVGHVEAGLRSFNRRMPEEINRIAADHVCDLLLAPTRSGMHNLFSEGLGARAVFSGDIMYDAVLQYRAVAEARSSVGARLGLEDGAYGVVTVHRAENTDDGASLGRLLSAFNRIADGVTRLVFPLHPRTRKQIEAEHIGWTAHKNLTVVEPIGYLDMLWLLDHAAVALTDSGGLQKEAFFLGCPCVTLRNETEWVETVESGGNVLVGTDTSKIVVAVEDWLARKKTGKTEFLHGTAEPFGQGDAAEKILETVTALATRAMGSGTTDAGRGAAVRTPERPQAVLDPTGIDEMIEIAVVGVGGWGKNLVRNYYQNPHCKLKTICDLDRKKLDRTQTQYPGTGVTTRFEDLLEDPHVQAIVVATAAPSHYQLCKAALLADKDVYVEKPFTLAVAEAVDLIRIAEERGRILMVGHLLEYHPVVNKLKEMIEKRELGDIFYIYNQRVNLGTVRGDENALWNFAPHDISSILYLLGEEPTDVAARGQCYLQQGIEDVVFLTLNFGGKRMAHVHVSWLDPHKIRKMTIVGSEKMAVFDDVEGTEKLKIYDKGAVANPDYNSFAEYITLRFGDITIPHLSFGEPLQLECSHFIECVRDRKRPLSDGVDGLRVIKVLDAAQRSLQSNGTPVGLGSGES